MKAIFTIILVLATAFRGYSPNFDYIWLMRGIEHQKAIVAYEAKNLKINKITAVIRHIESRGNYYKHGGSGEYGAYQFMPKTWRKMCHRYAGKYLSPTKENQDLIAFRYVEHLVEKGYSISQIGSVWNSGYPNCTKVGFTKTGVPFDVPAYRRFFVHKYKTIRV
jgi:hypothetical protein